jgi:cobalt/nickel transport system permease protein
VAKIALIAHVPVTVVEAVVSAFAVGFLSRVKPALLEGARD